MKIFAQHNEAFFKQYIPLENGIPTHNTIRRAMGMLNSDMLQSLVNKWHECIAKGETKTIQNSFILMEKLSVVINEITKKQAI